MNAVAATKWGEAMTAISVAAFYGHVDVVKALIKAGSKRDELSDLGTTALMNAAFKARLPVVKMLLKAGADPSKGGTILQGGLAPIHVASHTPGLESIMVMKALLEAGADINALDSSQSGPLAWAAYWGNLGTAKLLLDRGATIVGTHPALVICGCRSRVLSFGDPGPKCESGGCDSLQAETALYIMFGG